MKLITTFLALFFIVTYNSYARTYSVISPDGRVVYEVTIAEEIAFSVFYNGKTIIRNSTFGLQFDQSKYLGKDMAVESEKRTTINERWKPVVGQYAEILNHANELRLNLREKRFPGREFKLVMRAYNDGAAFRYVIPESFRNYIPNFQETTTIPLADEYTTFAFDSDYTVWAANYVTYDTHQESEFNKVRLSEIKTADVIGLPLLIEVASDCYAAITEADLTDWAGMYLAADKQFRTGEAVTLVSKLSPLPGSTNKVNVAPGAPSPWRVVMLGDSPGRLIESSILENLNDPCEISDPSGIKPGISAWDHWWSGEVKMDTETIIKYIDLAAEMGWEYMLIDWHWYGAPFDTVDGWKASKTADITTVNPSVDLPKVIAYAKSKKVDLLLWLLWDHVENQMDEAFALYESWGIKGVKIDFMARDDQEMVRWYHKVVKKAADHKLIVNFHGAYKPTGWTRTYPNLITREGVLGNEYSKWSSRITPEHNTTLPFTRMLAGQMDYTPGAFLNMPMGKFRTGSPAGAMGTRCHQLAMFVIYYSPLTVACDHPDNYRGQPGIEFLKEVPTTWHDTKLLDGRVGEYIAMARKNGTTWYIGAMTNSEARSLELDLGFLGDGKWEITYFRDSKDANVNAQKLETATMKVSQSDRLKVEMAPGGGYAAFIRKK